MHSPALSRPFHVLSILASSLALHGCLEDPPDPSAAPPTGAIHVRVGGSGAIPARAKSVEPGGRLILELRLDAKKSRWSDSLSWEPRLDATMDFPDLPEAGTYALVARYRDPQGRITHADSIFPVAIHRGSTTEASLSLHALLGRLMFTLPSVPTSVDTLSLDWIGAGFRRSSRVPRGTGGRTVLRLDSLPIGVPGATRIRAWDSQGDTLFWMDTILSLQSQSDQSTNLRLVDAHGWASVDATFLPGGELDATVVFPSDSLASHALVFAGFSDSGNSDWIRIHNQARTPYQGDLAIAHGTESVVVRARIGPDSDLVVGRAACPAPATVGFARTCGTAISVGWSTTGVLWSLRDSDGILQDRTILWDGNNGWPNLNTGSARTLRREPIPDGEDSYAGRSWCADDSDDPSGSCP